MAKTPTSTMAEIILPDTNILIHSLAGKNPYAQHFRKWITSRQLIFSVIVIAEFLIKANTKDQATLQKLVKRFPVLPIDLHVAQTAAEIRKTALKNKQKLHLPDCLIAAQCQLYPATLTTLNPSDYPKTEIKIISIFK